MAALVRHVVVIGSSCGGHGTLAEIFRGLPRIPAAVVVVQHMPAFVNDSLRDRLRSLCAMDVAVAVGGEVLQRGQMLIAPSEIHLRFDPQQVVRLEDGDKVSFARPSIDVAMTSLRRQAGQQIAAVVLTGMGVDGAAGIAHIKAIGGTTLVQSPSTCVIDGMPRAALDTGCVDQALSPAEIGGWLAGLTD